MRLARVRSAGSVRPIADNDGVHYDLSSALEDLSADVDIAAIRSLVATGDLPELDRDPGDFAVPVSRVGSVIAIGLNYAAHAAESGVAPPEQPVVFLKTPNTVAGPTDDFRLPGHAAKLDWEVELAMIISRRAYQLSDEDDPLSYVAGFTLANDLSERAFQLEESGGQWSKGKCLPGSTPLGPWLVPPGDIDVSDLRLQSWVNDEPRQDSRTSDLIFDPATIIAHLSHYLALEPGDVVLTGTPEGVALSGRFAYLRPGDVVRVAIEGLGEQQTTISDRSS